VGRGRVRRAARDHGGRQEGPWLPVALRRAPRPRRPEGVGRPVGGVAPRGVRPLDRRRVMAPKVWVLNGPNLGRLGRRQPEIYGHTTHDELVEKCVSWGAALDFDVEVRQTNHEGIMLDWLNEAADHKIPVLLNAAAW